MLGTVTDNIHAVALDTTTNNNAQKNSFIIIFHKHLRVHVFSDSLYLLLPQCEQFFVVFHFHFQRSKTTAIRRNDAYTYTKPLSLLFFHICHNSKFFWLGIFSSLQVVSTFKLRTFQFYCFPFSFFSWVHIKIIFSLLPISIDVLLPFSLNTWMIFHRFYNEVVQSFSFLSHFFLFFTWQEIERQQHAK